MRDDTLLIQDIKHILTERYNIEVNITGIKILSEDNRRNKVCRVSSNINYEAIFARKR